MSTRGMVYLVAARRGDGAWIYYRTCDRHEAQVLAERLGVTVSVEEQRTAVPGGVSIPAARRPLL
ncbi:MAG TPA: hypothetical protein VI248_21380 [Kineosporiaceae bacterium]